MPISIPLAALALAVAIAALASWRLLRRGLRRNSAHRRREALYMPQPRARGSLAGMAPLLPEDRRTRPADAELQLRRDHH
jgi:hypothetical protein